MAIRNNKFKDPGIHKMPPKLPSLTKTQDSSTNMMKPAVRTTSGDSKSVHPDFGAIGSATHAKIGK